MLVGPSRLPQVVGRRRVRHEIRSVGPREQQHGLPTGLEALGQPLGARGDPARVP